MTDAPLVFLVGPTGAGKTAAALALADRLPLEILSVDSAQVYRGLDIGTAKPDAAERAHVPHRLIDLVDPAEAYSAARFAEDAAACVDAARTRGRLPLLAGGTMLYARALVGGLDALPAADPELRARIDEEARVLGWPAMHARLAALDPVTAARLAPADSQRVQRALEVVLLTGTPLSALHGRATTPVRPAVFVSLEPTDRGWLHERLARRFDAMLEAGFLDEVRALRARGDLHPDLPSIRSVGYRQAWAHLDGDGDLDALRARATAATRQLAKRQLTWLRSMPERIVVPCDAPDAANRAAEAIRVAFGA